MIEEDEEFLDTQLIKSCNLVFHYFLHCVIYCVLNFLSFFIKARERKAVCCVKQNEGLSNLHRYLLVHGLFGVEF